MSRHVALPTHGNDDEARFPLPELTADLTGDRFPLPVNTGRVDGRQVNSGRQLG